MSTAVRRATRRHRCARCGFEATYPNAGAVEARYWFNRHSCQKRERLMIREVMAAIREEAIDRTPQPCLHKIAKHEHGQRATYVLDACRCIPCSKANAEAENERERMKAYGRYHKYVDAYPVRLHLAELKEYGIGLKQVGRVSGVSNGSLTKIWYGLYGPAEGPHKGCKGNGDLLRGPARRVLRTTAERIYAVEAVPQNLSVGAPDHERTPQARLHLQALVALGWSMSKLADRLGMLPTNLGPVIGTSTAGGPNRREGLRVLSRGTVDKIEALFEELSMTLPPRTEYRDKIAYSRALNYAAAAGWLPPLALDDLDHEPLDDESTDLDEVAIARRMAGDKSVALTKPEKHELARQWRGSGRPLAELERVTGLNSQRYLKTEQEQAS
jgi:transcriptional regulator with XRE-family HTH domain